MSKKILIAEDDLTSRTILRSLLEKWEHEVITASDGEEAWALLQQASAPSLVILDWMMPGMDGLALCKRLRAQKRPLPTYIILLTSKSDKNDVLLGLEAGADDFIQKPYYPEELRARIGVGKRILDLMLQEANRQKLQGVVEMAGAVCHELNQPLHIVSGYCELLLSDLDENSPLAGPLRIVKEQVQRIGDLTSQIMNITEYRTKEYLLGQRAIVDIREASKVCRDAMEERSKEEGAIEDAKKSSRSG